MKNKPTDRASTSVDSVIGFWQGRSMNNESTHEIWLSANEEAQAKRDAARIRRCACRAGNSPAAEAGRRWDLMDFQAKRSPLWTRVRRRLLNAWIALETGVV